MKQLQKCNCDDIKKLLILSKAYHILKTSYLFASLWFDNMQELKQTQPPLCEIQQPLSERTGGQWHKPNIQTLMPPLFH